MPATGFLFHASERTFCAGQTKDSSNELDFVIYMQIHTLRVWLSMGSTKHGFSFSFFLFHTHGQPVLVAFGV